MKTKFTPGPWLISRPVDGHVDVAAAGRPVLACGVSDADAALIAAAPDLYVAYADAVEVIHEYRHTPGAPFAKCEWGSCVNARDLLAKARGEQP